jgi:hypothetical protein
MVRELYVLAIVEFVFVLAIVEFVLAELEHERFVDIEAEQFVEFER